MKEILFNTVSDKINDTPEDINIVITGDYCFDRRVAEVCLKGEYSKIYGDALSLLRDKDISITNLECPLTEKGISIEKIGASLKASTICVEAIQYGEFNVVALANNHMLDKGPGGLEDTLKTCGKARIKTVGAGMNLEEASKPLYIEVKNQKVVILNFAEQEFNVATDKKAGVSPLDPISNYYQILEAKNNSDVLIVIIHGGNEHYHLPNPAMVKICRFVASLGVTAVVCHHTHCASGFENYNGVPIFYSLGNFIFDRGQDRCSAWFEGYFIKMTIRKDKVVTVRLVPYFQCKDKVGLVLMNDEDKINFINKIDKYSEIIKNDKKLELEWKKFSKSLKKRYLVSIRGLNFIERQLVKKGILTKFFLKNKKFWLTMLNFFRCQAHRELIIEAINDEIENRSKW